MKDDITVTKVRLSNVELAKFYLEDLKGPNCRAKKMKAYMLSDPKKMYLIFAKAKLEIMDGDYRGKMKLIMDMEVAMTWCRTKNLQNIKKLFK